MSPSSNNTKPGKPLWRSVVDRADRLITPTANNVVRTDMFAAVVSAMTRLEVRMRRRVDRQMTQVWHLYRLPSTVDMRRVLIQLAALEARLRDITERLDDLDAARPERQPDELRTS
jgi:Uri superfamily endonuclease